MPRSGRGGKRQGQPGKAYSQRSDMQAPSAAPGQTYGVQAQQLRAQQQIPLPKQAPPSQPAQVGGAAAGPPPPAAAAPMPGSLGGLADPTSRPNEPITAGLNTGAGPGPEALGGGGLSPIDEVRAMFAADPNDDMRRLLAYLDQA